MGITAMLGFLLMSVGTTRTSNLIGEIAKLRVMEVISGTPGMSLQHD